MAVGDSSSERTSMEVLLLLPVSMDWGCGLGLSCWGTWKGGLWGVVLRDSMEAVELDSVSSEDSNKSLSDKCLFFIYHLDFLSF